MSTTTASNRQSPRIPRNVTRRGLVAVRARRSISSAVGAPRTIRPETWVGAVFVCIVYYFISNILLELYTGGDRRGYRAFYEQISTLHLIPDNINTLSYFQKNITGSGEILYGLTAWFFSQFADNILFLSIFNCIAVLLLITILIRYKASYFTIPLVLTNFYFLVTLTSAERLKFSIICLMAALIISKTVPRIIFLISAPLFHMQTLVFYVSSISGRFIESFIKQIFSGRIRIAEIIASLMAAAGIFGFFYVFRDYIGEKSQSYSGSAGELVQVFLLLIISALTFRKNITPSISIFACAIFVLILGGQRVNMIAYMVYFYYACINYRLNNIWFLALSAYFSYKSIGYVMNIIKYGNGFAGT